MKMTSRRGSREIARKRGNKKAIVVCLLIIIFSAAGFGGWVYWQATAAPSDEVHQPLVTPERPNPSPPASTPEPEDPPEEIAAPTALIIDVAVPKGEEVTVQDFVRDVVSASPNVTIAFITEPDIFTVGDQQIEIIIEDDFGKSEIFSAVFTVIPNEEPPVIEGVRTIESMRGDAIIYRRGIYARDAFGRSLDFEVDSSDVDQNKTGRYTIIYRAEDIYGLVSEVEATVLIVNIDMDWVNERIEGIFEEIFTDDMTQVDQAQAIFKWIRGNMTFMARAAAPQSAYEGAYRALQDRRGGCTLYSSLSYVMLTQAEIPTLRIDRVPEAPSRHRWNLINPDGLGWYHFDSFPILLGGVRNELYMFTAEHAANFTRRMTAAGSVQMYYAYNPELYPEIVYECIDCPDVCL